MTYVQSNKICLIFKVTEDLDTGRIVRLSTAVFPKYFAVLSRSKGQVGSIGAEGGSVKANSMHGQVSVYFPPGNEILLRIFIFDFIWCWPLGIMMRDVLYVGTSKFNHI